MSGGMKKQTSAVTSIGHISSRFSRKRGGLSGAAFESESENEAALNK